MTSVKICGIKTPEILEVAVSAGAEFIGFVFYPSSSRYIDPEQASHLTQRLPASVNSVGLFVNPTDRDLEIILGQTQLDMLQLHGEESPERVEQIRIRYELPVIKAIPVSGHEDIAKAKLYENMADWLLFDTKAPAGEYGGTGQSFDWNLLKGHTFKKPWMLSGGLNINNINDALRILDPTVVDVSSGVESARGIKDAAKVQEFTQKVLSFEKPKGV